MLAKINEGVRVGFREPKETEETEGVVGESGVWAGRLGHYSGSVIVDGEERAISQAYLWPIEDFMVRVRRSVDICSMSFTQYAYPLSGSEAEAAAQAAAYWWAEWHRAAGKPRPKATDSAVEQAALWIDDLHARLEASERRVIELESLLARHEQPSDAPEPL